MAQDEEKREKWRVTSENAINAVVPIYYSHTQAFSGFDQSFGEATGFVVDTTNGYILTNRHVAGSGPFRGYCKFHSQETANLTVRYTDPVHDFAFLGFNPSIVTHQKLVQLLLRPNLAHVGLNIRIIGNNSGERLSIFDGTLSRLDRNSPSYSGNHNDFNTSYYQASTFSTGGSSGSPVIDIDGNVVALTAGVNAYTCSTFLLPLQRVLRALQCLQNGTPVTRGDVGCWFKLRPYNECQKLGLAPEDEAERRKEFPEANDLPVATRIATNGPSHGKVEEGDVILKIDDQLVGDLGIFDEIFDKNVGKTIKLQVQRERETLTVYIKVQNLHDITPDRFVSACGTNFNNLSYNMAVSHGIACRGIYVNSNHGSFSKCSDSLIETINHQPINDLDRLVDVMQSISDRDRVPVKFRRMDSLHHLQSVMVWIDRHFTPKMSLVVRNKDTGVWDWEELSQALPPVPVKHQKGKFISPANIPPDLKKLSSCFVHLECRNLELVNGIRKREEKGMGMVIDSDRGLVITSRTDVTHYLCDITITIANTIIIEGKVVFLHPDHGYAIVRYDPQLVGAPVQAVKLSRNKLQQNEEVYFIGFLQDQRCLYDKTTVTTISPINLEMDCVTPRTRAVHIDVATIATPLGEECCTGVLTDVNGTVCAFWLPHFAYNELYSYHTKVISLGLPARNVLQVLSEFHPETIPVVQILPAEFEPCLLADACGMGMNESSALSILERASPDPRALRVARQMIRPEIKKDGFVEGDLLISLEGNVISDMSGLEVAYTKTTVKAEVIRDGQYLTLDISTIDSSDLETRRIVHFGGAFIQSPHLEVRRRIGELPSEVYVSSIAQGSPFAVTRMGRSYFITKINHQTTTDLDSFFNAVNHIEDNTDVIIKTINLWGYESTFVMRTNTVDFPTRWILEPTR